MNRPYIICLKFGTWRNELWFTAPDDEEFNEKWKKAVDGLPLVSEMCTNSNDFMAAAVKYIEEYGFARIQR